MGFNGYLIKIGNYSTFFNKFIVSESYKISKKVIDLDSYRDANGVLHRNALPHVSYTISFEVKPLDNTRMQELLSSIRENFTIPAERKLSVSFYVPELDDYVTTDCYMPDPEFPINRIETQTIIPVIYYDKITLKFIGY